MVVEVIIGHISEELHAAYKAAGRKLRFLDWTRSGQPIHQVIA